jgi:hypothetical protein
MPDTFQSSKTMRSAAMSGPDQGRALLSEACARIRARIPRQKPPPKFCATWYGAPWRKLRDQVLANEPLCRRCADMGRTVPAVQVDHIMPKESGGTDAFDNLQPLCLECHRLKTGREDSSPAQLIPSWLEPSAIPVTIVCGPPGAGKTSFIARHKRATDLVIDLDEIIANLAQMRLYRAGQEWLTRGIRRREYHREQRGPPALLFAARHQVSADCRLHSSGGLACDIISDHGTTCFRRKR